MFFAVIIPSRIVAIPKKRMRKVMTVILNQAQMILYPFMLALVVVLGIVLRMK
jgi:hypothetical protein